LVPKSAIFDLPWFAAFKKLDFGPKIGHFGPKIGQKRHLFGHFLNRNRRSGSGRIRKRAGQLDMIVLERFQYTRARDTLYFYDLFEVKMTYLAILGSKWAIFVKKSIILNNADHGMAKNGQFWHQKLLKPVKYCVLGPHQGC